MASRARAVRLLSLVLVFLGLWGVVGLVAGRRLTAQREAAVDDTVAAVRALVDAAREDVRREAALLARDPAILDDPAPGDHAGPARGASSRLEALVLERRADLVVIADAAGEPLAQVPAGPRFALPELERPAKAVGRVVLAGERPFFLGLAPLPGGLVVVARTLESLGGQLSRLPSRPALVALAGDRALAGSQPGLPRTGWDAAARDGRVVIRGEAWAARPLADAGAGLWALLPGGEPGAVERRFWVWWAAAPLAAALAAVAWAARRRRRAPAQPVLARGSRELDAIHALAEAAGDDDDLATTAAKTLEAVARAARIDVGAILRLDATSEVLTLVAHRGLPSTEVERSRISVVDGSAVAEAARTGRPVLTDPARISLPITWDGRTWGVLALTPREQLTLGGEELVFLEALARQAGAALGRAALLDHERIRRTDLATVLEINKRIAGVSDTEALLASIAEEAARLLGVDNAGFRLVEGDELVLVGLTGMATEAMLRPRIGIDESLSGRVVTGGQTLACELDRAPQPIVPEHLAAARRLGYTTFLGVPVRTEDRILGVLSVRGRGPFTADHRELAEAFAGQAAIALERSRLRRDADRQSAQVTALADLGRLLSETFDFDRVAQRVADSLCALLGARSSCLYRLDPASGELVAVTVSTASRGSFPWIEAISPDTGVAGLAACQRRTVASSDVLEDARITYSQELRAYLARQSDRALVAVPLLVRDRLVGTLVVGDRAGRRFTEEETRVAQAFADQAALALENARLYREAQERLRETETLLSVSRALSSTLDLQALLRHLLQSVTAVTGADSGGIWMLTADGETLEGIAGYHIPPGALAPLRRLRLSIARDSFYAEAVRTRRPVFSPDVQADPRIPASVRRAAPHRAQLFVPIVTKDRLLGGIELMWWERVHEVCAGEMALLEAIATQAGVAIENARLFEENRRQVQELSVLHELSQAVTGQLDRAAVVEAIRAQVARVLNARSIVILRCDEAQSDLEVILRVVDGVPDMGPPLRYPRHSVGLMSVVLETGRPVRTDDYVGECTRRGVEAVAASARLQHWLGVPMVAGDTVLGVLALRGGERPFTAADERLLSDIAHLAELALRSVRLFEERTRAYAELAAAQDQLVRTEKLHALGEMASGVAHDFNNLLASILGRAQLALQRVDDPQLRHWIQVIERSALDGAQTVRRLQEFTRIRRDQPFVVVDLNQVVRDALEITRSRWRDEPFSRGVALEVRTSLAEIPPVAGDPAELREALTNLILNAVDAMPRGGALSLTTAVVDGAVVATVSDTGEGIPEAIRARVFDPFFTTKGPHGTGLGLSMTYGILERHRARIDVESAVGRGTTFRLTFAPGAPPQAEAVRSPTVSGVGLPPLRCLVVDDEPMVGTMLGDVLESAGHHVVVLCDGAEAIARFGAEPFDLVITDLAMPRVSGWEVALAIKEIAPAVAVLLLTGFGVELSEEERLKHGVDRVLGKPLRIDEILAAVAQVTRRAGQPIRTEDDR